jgi:lysophospholipase L1-like esterase
MSFERLRHFYRVAAVLVLNTLILLLLVNISLFVFYSVKDRHAKKDHAHRADVPASQMKFLKDVYPNLSHEEVNVLRRETAAPARGLAYDPYTAFREPPFTGRYLNVDANGFRRVKNQGPWPPDKDKHLTVFVFGGSTTFGYSVPDDETIPSHLQELLSAGELTREVRVYNFGQASFYSTQERILFERLVASGFVPDVAIFIDGLNDFFSYDDRPMFYERLKALVEGDAQAPSPVRAALASIPLVRAAGSLNTRLARSLNNQPAAPPLPPDEIYNDREKIMRVIERYAAHKRMVEAVASVNKVKPVFVWQPVPMYKYDTRHHPYNVARWSERYAYVKYGYPAMAEFVGRNPQGDNFLWCADMQEKLAEPLYVDATHYSGKMSRMVAREIFGFVKEKKLLPFKN